MSAPDPPFLGHDGLATLAAALAVAVLSAGLAPLIAAAAVFGTARRAAVLPAGAPARIIVLGHRLQGGAPSGDFVARLRRAVLLAHRFPAARVLVLGGQTAPGGPAEAEAGRAWLLAEGLDAARIEVETRSRHTLENLRNHRDTHPSAAVEALVTSRLHLHRAMLMARGLRLAPEPVAAEDALRMRPAWLLLEGFMVQWYVTGRTMARLLRRTAWLERIG